ncbi:MAG: hypothetical protein Q4C04_04470 [Clostridia bacterium]|nr:hypothetical protein [Clostridia bacterium]
MSSIILKPTEAGYWRYKRTWIREIIQSETTDGAVTTSSFTWNSGDSVIVGADTATQTLITSSGYYAQYRMENWEYAGFIKFAINDISDEAVLRLYASAGAAGNDIVIRRATEARTGTAIPDNDATGISLYPSLAAWIEVDIWAVVDGQHRDGNYGLVIPQARVGRARRLTFSAASGIELRAGGASSARGKLIIGGEARSIVSRGIIINGEYRAQAAQSVIIGGELK